MEDLARLIDDRLAPVAMAGDRLLAVPDPLVDLFPSGGLQRGWSVGFDGIGGWSVAMALLATTLGSDGWAACVGVEEFGLVAADEIGVPLDRVVMVESPGPSLLPEVVAALVEAVDVVCLGPLVHGSGVRAKDAARLSARTREQGAVLFHLDAGRSWPRVLDVRLTAEPGSSAGGWTGLGWGHGRLRSRSLTITSEGRRSMARQRRVEVLLPGPGGGIAPVATGSTPTTAEGVVWPVSA